jgi:hypothetical protein
MRDGYIAQNATFKEVYDTHEFQEVFKKLSKETASSKEIQEEKKVSMEQRKVK